MSVGMINPEGPNSSFLLVMNSFLTVLSDTLFCCINFLNTV